LQDNSVDRKLSSRWGVLWRTSQSTRVGGEQPDFGATFKFPHVFEAEIDLINKRREHDPRGTIKLEHEAKDVSGDWVWRPPENAKLVGLALSGGGIRSAAFCLGVLQALDETKVFPWVDYLSTVSGGGYIGCSLTAALEKANRNERKKNEERNFPFRSGLEEDEPPALQHIRDFSNYLFPNGVVDWLYNASVYTRGPVVNAVLVAPFILGASALTLLYYWLHAAPKPQALAFLLNPFRLSNFMITADLAVLLVIGGVAWALLNRNHRVKAKRKFLAGEHIWQGGL
jgi:hypothetical protein